MARVVVLIFFGWYFDVASFFGGLENFAGPRINDDVSNEKSQTRTLYHQF